MKTNRLKFKVLKLESYLSFKKSIAFWANASNTKDKTDNEILELSKTIDDSPLDYLEECEEMPFPTREEVQYCVRNFVNKKIFEPYKNKYSVYCYQLGRWWKVKRQESILDLHVPRMSLYDYTKISYGTKYFSEHCKLDWYYWSRFFELRKITRSIDRNFMICMR